MTPIQKLQAAIEEFAEENDNRADGVQGTMSGWVLGYQMTYFNDDPEDQAIFPVVFDSTYALGPTTSQDLAIGLSRRAQHLIERALDDEDDDD